MHIFYLNPTLLNLKLCSSTFMQFEVVNSISQNYKKKKKTRAGRLNNVSLTFSSLSMNDASFKVIDLGLAIFNWAPILSTSFNWTHNRLQTFNFIQFHQWQTHLSASKLVAFFILVLDLEFVHFNPELTSKLSIFSIWPLIWSI